MSHDPEKSFIIDANALIDYCDSDLQVLAEFSLHIGTVYIARSTFEKVKQLPDSVAKKHHLVVKTADLATVIEASAVRGSLAYDDRETLLLAKRHEWLCITNDVQLRRKCRAERIACLWGLEPMKLLVERSVITGAKAIDVAVLIQKSNPKYITNAIVGQFVQEIDKIQAGIRKK